MTYSARSRLWRTSLKHVTEHKGEMISNHDYMPPDVSKVVVQKHKTGELIDKQLRAQICFKRNCVPVLSYKTLINYCWRLSRTSLERQNSLSGRQCIYILIYTIYASGQFTTMLKHSSRFCKRILIHFRDPILNATAKVFNCIKLMVLKWASMTSLHGKKSPNFEQKIHKKKRDLPGAFTLNKHKWKLQTKYTTQFANSMLIYLQTIKNYDSKQLAVVHKVK